jgi:hypothetical protein
MTLLMQTKTISTVSHSRFFTFSFIIFFFNLFAGTSLGQSTTLNSLDYISKGTTQNKYNVKAEISVKDKTSLMSLNSSDLTWINVNNKPVLKNLAWTFEDNNYIWKPSDESQFIKIPLRQKITANRTSPELVNKIEIEYRDLLPDNPVLPLVQIVTLDKKNLTKTILHFQGQPFNEELLDVSSASWVKKNNLYLARRALGIKLKPAWRYSQDGQNTVLQRGIEKNLLSFDSIDLVLDEELNENIVNTIISNFRILDLKSGKEHIIPHAHFDPVLIRTEDKNIIRYKVTDYIQRTNLKIGRTARSLYLKEIIIFLPGSVEEVVRIGPLKSILFLKQRNELSRHIPGKVQSIENKTTFDHENVLPKLKNFKSNISVHYLEIKNLSIDSKRLIIKLPKINNTTNNDKGLESIDLFIRPTNPNQKSGFHLQRAQKIIRNKKNIDLISLEKTISNGKSAHHSIWELPLTTSSTVGGFSVINLIYKLVLFFIIVLIAIWMWVKGRRITKQNWFTENIASINQCRQQLYILLVKITPSRNQIILLNRLFGIALLGLAGGIIISNNLYAEHIIFISTILLILGVFLNEFKLKNNNLKKLSLVLAINCATFLWFVWLLVYSDQSLARFIGPLLVLAYFNIPWFSKFLSSLLNAEETPASFWLTAAGTTYLIASILLIEGCSFKSFINILSIGHLAIVPYWGHIIQNIQKRVEYYFPDFAGIVYDSKENIYVTGFFVFVLVVALFRTIDLSILAEQFSIIAFYLLIAGVTLKVKTLFKPKSTPQVISSDL